MELRDVQSALRASIEDRATTIGSFIAIFNEKSPNPFFNYAVPVQDARPTDADVAALVAAFRERDRTPRLEYVRPAPDVDGPLATAGFDVNSTLTLMALTEFVPAPDCGFAIEFVSDEPTLYRTIVAQNIAYGEQDAEPDPSGLLRVTRSGGAVAVARTDDGTVTGAGLFTPPQGGLAEVGAVGVLPDYRRRGIGRAVTSALTAEALRRGHQPFLQVEKDEPERIYQRIGYRVIGDLGDARLV